MTGCRVPADGGRAPRPTVEVVVVAFGSFPLLQRCLDSLSRHVATEVDLLVHVVDNASPDGTADAVASAFPEVTLWRNPTNSGFAHGTNIALRQVTSPYVLLLNPDTEVGPGVLPHLLEVLAGDPSIGMIGPRLERLDGTFDHAAKRSVPRPGSALRYFFRRGGPSSYLAPQVDERGTGRVEAINGAFMLVRRDALEVVGLLDERYWMYGEDLDWCVRFADAGFDVVYDGRVSAVHVKGATSDRHRSLKLIWHFHRSMVIFYREHGRADGPATRWAVHLGIAARWFALSASALAHRIMPVRPSGRVRNESIL